MVVHIVAGFGEHYINKSIYVDSDLREVKKVLFE